MARRRLSYEGVAVAVPVTVPYVRYSTRSAHWFIDGSCFQDPSDRLGTPMDRIADLDNPLSREKLRAPGMQAGNRRLLGIQLEELNVVEVMDDGVAAKAGMRDGDIIIKIDGAKLVDRLELTTAIQKGERKKTIVVLRDGKEIELTVEWPAASKKANDAEKK